MYDDWRGRFYPDEARKSDWLARYAERFDAVEVNGTFYRMPTRETVAGWRATVPAGFRFAVKAHRFITHNKKLTDPAQPLSRLFHVLEPLGDKLGPVLFQLPPGWRANPGRLADFLRALPREHRYAFEFRNRSWLCEAVFDLLAEHRAALCLYHLAGYQSPERVTTDFVYLRLHGPEGAYQGSYDGRALRGWARRIARWSGEEGRAVWCFFDNDQKANAPHDATRLAAML